MQTKQIRFDESLDNIGTLLQKQRYKQALEATHMLSQTAMQQQLQLMLQRYLAELSMECLELNGNFDTALEFCDFSLEQYPHPEKLKSDAAKKDYLALAMRKLCLMIKLDQRFEAQQFTQQILSVISDEQAKQLKPILSRLNRYGSGAIDHLTKEQKQIGLFHLTDTLAKHGAKALMS